MSPVAPNLKRCLATLLSLGLRTAFAFADVQSTSPIIGFDPALLASATCGMAFPHELSEFDCQNLRLVTSTIRDNGVHLVFIDDAQPSRRASLLLREGRLSGAIDHPDALQERLISLEAGRSIRELVDVTQELPCGGPMRPNSRLRAMDAPPRASLTDGCDDGSVLDVAVFYTTAAMNQAGSRDAIVDQIEWAIADSNTIYLNSGISLTLRLVTAQEASDYTESSSWMGDDLDALSTSNDGALDAVHAIRDAVGADLVALVRSSGGGACGVAWLLPDMDASASSAWGFSVTALSCLSNRTFTHELGHNMGCCHAPGDGGGCLSGGIFPYSVGHRFDGTDGVTYRTVMAYAPGTRIPYFSSAIATYQGMTTGLTDMRDNARTIIETNPVTTNFRCSVEPIGSGNVVRCWGADERGQSTGGSNVRGADRVAAGALHSVASRTDGTVVCWGSNDFGQCSTPSSIPPVTDVDAGVRHTVALGQDGLVYCWGANEYGQSTPPADLNDVASIASGGYHSLALQASGMVRAWGQNNYAQCVVPGSVSAVSAIGAGISHSLAVRIDGSVAAWGRNDKAQCSVPASTFGCTMVAGGDLHSLALRNDGTVAAWGNNAYGQCTVPTDLTSVIAVAAGSGHSVALTSAGLVRAWGRNQLGQTSVPAGLEGVSEIDSGGNHVIAVLRVQDCDENGIADALDIAAGAADLDADGRIDSCEIAKGDMDLSGQIDFGDVALVLLDFGPCLDCGSDLDGTDQVDFGDVALVLLSFGPAD